ncbi:Exocyst complex component 2 [Cladochytrium tenue]|nr:Exocyst complex component 2 [Cladochytrium tenue]
MFAHLDALLLGNYVRRKALQVAALVRAGVLYSGLDWARLARPSDVRPHIHDVLLVFVACHAEAADAARGSLSRILAELLRLAAVALTGAYREVDTFSDAGALQATLETEFLHQTLGAHETRAAREQFALAYAAIERGAAAARAANGVAGGSGAEDAGARDEQQQQQQREAVKDILRRAREAGALQYACFRGGTPAAGGGDGGGEGVAGGGAAEERHDEGVA